MLEFSVIIPVYNAEKYLIECLESIVNQTYQNFEAILVDDGSTDGSYSICKEYCERYNNFSLIHKENGGLSSARNAGIKAANGEYLIFVDSDDFLTDSDALSNINSALTHNSPDLLIGSPIEYDESGKQVVLSFPGQKWSQDKVYAKRGIIDSLYRINGIWVTMAQTKILKRLFCLENDLFFCNGIYHEDDEWIARMLIKNPSICFLYRSWYGYRHRAESITSSVNKKTVYKKLCDKVFVASSMINNAGSYKYANYIKYAYDYLFWAMISSNNLDENFKAKFLEHLTACNIDYHKAVFSKNCKTILKVIYIRLFGEKRFIAKYKE